ncbi:MAG: 2-hydroxyacyl-CoA dehydratase family protein [Bacillota bacterium]
MAILNLQEALAVKIKDGLKTRVLRSPWTYRLLRGAVRHSHFPLETSRQMALYALQQTERAYTGVAPVVWTSAFFPTEIPHALGLTVFSPEVAAALLASLGLAEECLDTAERFWYDRDLCSFHRCVLGATLKGYFPSPTALLATGHICDSAPKTFEAVGRLTGARTFFLDVPRERTPEAEAYIAAQLRDIARELAAVCRLTWHPERLVHAVEASERFRNAAVAANLARVGDVPWRGSDMLNFVYLLFVGQGDPQAAAVYTDLAREAARQPAREKTRKPRLLWLHLKPYFDPSLLNYLEEERGAAIVFEEMNYVYWPSLAGVSPWRGLARKTLAHHAYHTTTERAAVLVSLARCYRADGVVMFAHQGCRATTGALHLLGRLVQQEGLPFLALQGDCIDRRDYAPEQLRTRLDAFLEMLEDRTVV